VAAQQPNWPRSADAWVVDDTGFPKDGSCSVGVQRQYSGTLGKTANCQLGVSVDAVTEQASCPLDWRLFVPERWDDAAMAARRAACHCPKACTIGPSGSWCWTCWMSWPAGSCIRRCCWPTAATATSGSSAPASTGKGRRPRPRDHDQRCSLKDLALQAGQRACIDLIWRRGSKGLQRGRFPALRVRPAGVTPRRQARQDGTELPVHWLLVEWPTGNAAPVKYWLSNLPERTPIVELVRLARLRWRVEQDYRECKRWAGSGSFRGARLARLAPSCDLGLGRVQVPGLGAAPLPKSGGVGLTVWQLLDQLQVLLACWAGACPVCQRPVPGWLRRTRRSRAPT
jgi:hypothetical protein